MVGWVVGVGCVVLVGWVVGVGSVDERREERRKERREEMRGGEWRRRDEKRERNDDAHENIRARNCERGGRSPFTQVNESQ